VRLPVIFYESVKIKKKNAKNDEPSEDRTRDLMSVNHACGDYAAASLLL
jgi:hypothetical protein